MRCQIWKYYLHRIVGVALISFNHNQMQKEIKPRVKENICQNRILREADQYIEVRTELT